MLPAADTFKAFFNKYTNAIVALSGGADSACVLMLAVEHMGRENVLAATCANSQFFSSEVDNARKTAELLGVGFVTFTAEMPKEFFLGGDKKCYHCKKAIMTKLSESKGFQVIFDGTNADDDTIERKGFKAVSELGVVSPLLELGLGKSFVNEKCSGLGISFRDESCKATRLSGPIDEVRMNIVEDFETQLRDKFPGVRYRIDDKKVVFKKPVQFHSEDFQKISLLKKELDII